MIRKHILSTLTIALFPLFNFAQFGFEFDDSLLVIKGSDTLNNPWGGGLNYPQFSDFDYDFLKVRFLFSQHRKSEAMSLLDSIELTSFPKDLHDKVTSEKSVLS